MNYKGNYFIHGNIYFRCTGTWTCLISRHVTTNPIIVTSFIPGTIEIISFWGYSKHNLLLKHNKEHVLISPNTF